MTDKAQRLGALAGALFCVLFYVVFLTTGDTPDVNASASAIADHYDSAAKSAFAAISCFVLAVSFLFFAGAFRSIFNKANWLSSVMSTSAAIVAVGFGLFGMSQIMLYDARKLDGAVLQTLNVIDNDNFLPVAIGVSAFLIAAGARIVSTRVLPKWFGWVAIVLGAIAVTGPPGFLTFVLFPLWVGAASVMLFMRRGQMATDSGYVDLTTPSTSEVGNRPISAM